MYNYWCLPVLLVGLGAVLQEVTGRDDGYVFLSREQENYVIYHTGSSTNWRPGAEGSLYLKFRTSYKDGLLAFAEGPTGRLQLWLEEGKLRIEYSLNGATELVFTVGRRLNTDATFDLVVYKDSARVGAILNDSVNAVLYEEEVAHGLVWDLDSYVYVGGVQDALKAKIKAPAKFIGCISDVGLSNSSTVEVASASRVAQSGVITGNCASYNFCEDAHKCARAVDCVNLWNDTACDCRTAPKDGPTCNEYEFNSVTLFLENQYICTNLTLLTEPAFQALESLHFVTDVNDYFTADPSVFLYLTSNANPDTGVAVVGFYNGSGLHFEARVYFPNGTVASTGTVSYFASISVKRYSDEVVITNSFGPSVEQRLSGLETLADLDLDRLCIGGGAPGLRHPNEGSISRLFVNGINILPEGGTFDTVDIDLTSVRFLTPESKYAVAECPQDDMALEFSFVTYDQNAVLATFTTHDPSRNLTFKIVNSEMEISLGDEIAVVDGTSYGDSEVQSISNGRKYSVTMALLAEGPSGLIIFVSYAEIFNTYSLAYPSLETLTVCTNGMTIGEDFVGCLQDLRFGFEDTAAYNFSLEGLLGLSNRKCRDPCEPKDLPGGIHCDMGTCLAISETEYRCPGMLEGSTSISVMLSTTATQSTASITASPADPSPSGALTVSPSSSSSLSPSSFPSPSSSPSSSLSPSPSPTSSTNATTTPTSLASTPPLGVADIAGIVIGSVIGLCIAILTVVIIVLACLIVANRQGYYPTKEASVNESTLLRHNASLRSVSSTRPLHSSPKREAEYYI